MELLFFWCGLSIVVGYVAGQRGRSGAAWFLLACLISPLLAVILLALLPNQTRPTLSLEHQVRDRMLEQQFAQYIRGHKPAFSNSVVYDVNINGLTGRFRTKAEAIAFCASHVQPTAWASGQPAQAAFHPPSVHR